MAKNDAYVRSISPDGGTGAKVAVYDCLDVLLATFFFNVALLIRRGGRIATRIVTLTPSIKILRLQIL